MKRKIGLSEAEKKLRKYGSGVDEIRLGRGRYHNPEIGAYLTRDREYSLWFDSLKVEPQKNGEVRVSGDFVTQHKRLERGEGGVVGIAERLLSKLRGVPGDMKVKTVYDKPEHHPFDYALQQPPKSSESIGSGA